MTDDSESPSVRPGTAADLSRRMDRLERNHEELGRQVLGLTGTVAQVELNQRHAEELSKLRFGSLDVAIANVGSKQDVFIARMESLISGETVTAQTRTVMAEYEEWKTGVNSKLEKFGTFETQGRLIGNMIKLLVAGNVIAIIAALAAVLK